MDPMYRIGIDVGGTHTDAVLMEGERGILAASKRLTTDDILSGIQQAVKDLASQSGIGLPQVSAVMLGTTQFVNALVQQRNLAKVLAVRLCGPATIAMPPFIDFPQTLAQTISAGQILAGGGFEYDGSHEISAITQQDIEMVADRICHENIPSVVICGVFSPVNAKHEQEFADGLKAALAARRLQGVTHITLSNHVGHLGLLERENAAILNAALLPLAASVIPKYRAALAGLGMAASAQLYLTANDGTLLSMDTAQQMPIATLQSGPVNSLRGAAFLTGCTDAVVIDIGGTSTDVGVVANGLPRPAGKTITICGVRTNFTMPDVASIGLGGGSHVQVWTGGAANTIKCTVGPLSVGNHLLQRSLSFGGDTLTATDIALFLGKMQTESQEHIRTAACVDLPVVQASWKNIQDQLAGLVDNIKSQRGDVPVIVVGGAAALCDDDLPGASHVIRPQHSAVANAVGAAIPQVSGSVDAVFPLGPAGEHRAAVLQQAIERATAAAVAAGAVLGSCEVVEQEDIPLSYMPGGAARVRVRVVGDLDLSALKAKQGTSTQAVDSKQQPGAQTPMPSPPETHDVWHTEQGGTSEQQVLPPSLAFGVAYDQAEVAQHGSGKQAPDLAGCKRRINQEGEWELSELDVDALALGAAVLGTGGGGSAHNARLRLLNEMKRYRDGQHEHTPLSATTTSGADSDTLRPQIQAVSGTATPSSKGKNWPRVLLLSLLADDAMLVDCGGMGAPTVGVEKLDAYDTQAAVEALAAHMPQPLTALLCAEVGGGNCLQPLVVGTRMGLPVLDADLMGRAFPELQMTTSAIAGIPLTPAALADEKGNALVMPSAASSVFVERIMRAACTEMGCTAGLATSPMSGATAKRVAILHSLSLAWRLGMSLLTAHKKKTDPVAAVIAAYGGTGLELFAGKIVDVKRATTEGFARGCVVIDGRIVQMPQAAKVAKGSLTAETLSSGSSSQDNSQLMTIDFQNENLVASLSVSGIKHVVASVPDLICCLEADSGLAIATEDLRYGLRVRVVALPAHPLLTTPEALKVVGPAAFGYQDVSYVPVGQFVAWHTEAH